MQHVDLDYHMEQGTKSMRANRWVLEDKTISVCTWLIFFLDFAPACQLAAH